MKRYFSLLLCLFTILVFSGCVNNTAVIEIQSFENTVEIVRDNFKLKGKLSFINPDEMSMIISEPVEIENVIVSYLGGKITVSCDELTVDIDSVSLGNDVFSPLFEALKVISASGIQVEKTGINEVNIPSYGINLTFSSDEMKIISLKKDSVFYKFT